MTIIKGYTIYDRKALTYSPPFFAVADGIAVRMFTELAGDISTQVGRHPADFVLFRCGGYDDSNGGLLPIPALEHVVDALAVIPRHAPLPFDPLDRTGPNGTGKIADKNIHESNS